MRVVKLELDHFRLYERLRLELDTDEICFSGVNAAGKTSLLEAIYYLGTVRSFRFAEDRDLLRHGADLFAIRAEIKRGDEHHQLALTYSRGGKQVAVDGERCNRLSELLGRLVVCLFTVEDLDTIRGSAARRRRFMDLLLAQVSPAYTKAMGAMTSTLRQRNAALRAEPFDSVAVAVWEDPLARACAAVTALRRSTIDELSQLAPHLFAELSGSQHHLALDYEGAIEETRLPAEQLEEPFLQLFRKNRERDRRRGYTTKGSQRDDLALTLDGSDLRRYASRGQQRLAMVALRLAEADFLGRHTGTKPVFLLDDVASELDDTASSRLLPALRERVGQLIVTALPDDLSRLGIQGRVMRVADYQVTPLTQKV